MSAFEAAADEVAPGPFADHPAGGRGTGEHHVVGPVDERGTDVRALAAHHLEQPLRQAGPLQQLNAVQRGEGRLVVRFQHDRVARHQRRHGVGDAGGEREVPRRDDADDTLGLPDLGG
jgi:hypothetical protein